MSKKDWAPAGVYGTVAAYTMVQYVSIVIIPLYLAREGLGALVLGILASVPGLLMLLLRMPAGMLIDRIGARWVARLAVASAGTGGLLLVAAAMRWMPPLVGLSLAQAFFGAGRAGFWPAIRTYLTWWDHGTRASRFGMLTVFEGLGGVAGPAVTGLLFAATGPLGTSLTLVALAVLGLMAGAAMPVVLPEPQGAPARGGARAPERGGARAPERGSPGSRSMETGAAVSGSTKGAAGATTPDASGPVSVWRLRPVYLSAACDFSAGLVLVSVGSFLPVYLLVAGLSESLVGLLTSVRGLTLAAAGPLYDRWFRQDGYRAAWLVGMGLTGLGFVAIPLLAHPLPLTAAVGLLGLGSGILQVLSTVVVADFTPAAQMGLAMAYSGMFRSAAIFVVPAALGLAVSGLGLASAFWLPAAPLLAAAAAHRPLLRWGLARPAAPLTVGSPAPHG